MRACAAAGFLCTSLGWTALRTVLVQSLQLVARAAALRTWRSLERRRGCRAGPEPNLLRRTAAGIRHARTVAVGRRRHGACQQPDTAHRAVVGRSRFRKILQR